MFKKITLWAIVFVFTLNLIPVSQVQAKTYTKIMGKSILTSDQLETFLLNNNPKADQYVSLIDIYIEEGETEGVRGDLAFLQSCLETGYFTFQGDVSPNQNNYAGIGTVGGGVKGNSFSSPRIGIRAQIQHLKAYASTLPLNKKCVDPRFNYVKRGSAKYIEHLSIPNNPNNYGWAADKNYHNKILSMLKVVLNS